MQPSNGHGHSWGMIVDLEMIIEQNIYAVIMKSLNCTANDTNSAKFFQMKKKNNF